MKKIACTVLALAACTGLALAQGQGPMDRSCKKKFQTTFTETYEGGSNVGGWTFGNAADRIEEKGGHPNDYLRNDFLSTFAVRFRTAVDVASPFNGNLRAKGVIEMGADFKTFFAAEDRERPMSLLLVNFNGTPDEPFDDKFVFYVTDENMPGSRGAWESYKVRVPTDRVTAPTPISTVEGDPGWVIAEGDLFTPASDPDAVWNDVIENVDQVLWWWHDPRFFALIQSFDAGADNISVTTCTN